MSETAAEQHVNGTAPAQAAAEQPCEDCATPGEKLLAVLAAVLGAFIIVMAFDMFTGGRITGNIAAAVQQATE